jgi:hypothetical protein
LLGAFGLIGMLGAQKGPLSSAAVVKKFYLKIAEDNSIILYNNKKIQIYFISDNIQKPSEGREIKCLVLTRSTIFPKPISMMVKLILWLAHTTC